MKNKNPKIVTGGVILLAFTLVFVGFFHAMAAPTTQPGVGTGAIGSDASLNVSVGTTTPGGLSRLYIVASSTLGTNYSLKVVQPNGTPVFTVGNDGSLTLTGTFAASALTGTISASNVSADQFGRLAGNGNFSFPASVGIGTTTPSQLLTVGNNNQFTVTAAGNVALTYVRPSLALYNTNASNVQGLIITNGTGVGNEGVASISQTYPSAASQLWFGTQNTERMRIDGNGNVGIGTAAPFDDLDVASTGSGGLGGRIVITNKATDALNNEADLGFKTSASYSAGYYSSRIVSLSANYPTNNYGDLAFYNFNGGNTSGTEMMRIKSNGYVGIGTSSPQRALDVYGAGTGIARITGGGTGAPARRSILELVSADARAMGVITNINGTEGWFFGEPYGGTGFTIGNSSTQAEYLANSDFYITTAGNVGIANTAPAYKLDVNGTANFTGQVSVPTPTATSSAANKAYVDSAVGGGSGPWTLSGSVVYTSSSTNKVGIGTTTPDQLLSVNGNLDLGPGGLIGSGQGYVGGGGAASYATLKLYNGATGFTDLNNQGYGINLQTGGVSKLTILNNGNVGIGTSTPSQLLTVGNNNQFTVTSAGAVTAASFTGPLVERDIRTISPSNESAATMRFGFTSFANNNSSPYADFLHLRSYVDASGGADNLVVFNKSTIGMRIYQQTFGTTTAYSSYRDAVMTDVGAADVTLAGHINVAGSGSSFTQPVTVGTPTAAGMAATKAYVDTAVSGGSTNGNFTTLNVTGGWTISGAASSSLNMNGFNITGLNKLTVTTIDPVYNIGDAKYATYGPESIGIVVTSDGKGRLQKISNNQQSGFDYEYVIDFGNAAKGSDSWLFWQTINEGQGMKNITLALTPEGGFSELWYSLAPAKKQIVIHGDREAAFSYHLSAPRRYDSSKYGNVLTDSSEPGVVLQEK